MAFSSAAYTISSSKKESKALFEKLNIKTPKSWPECSFPVIIKPSFGSGSKGVRIFRDRKDLYSYLSTSNVDSVIIEEYVHGKQYSLEIIGLQGRYRCLQVTELEMDDIFDCKRVIAPSGLSLKEVTQLEEIAVLAARTVELNGIMDIEVIYHNGEFIALEIDARLPSQTPIAVFWSTGFNIIENLVNTYLGRNTMGPLLILKTSVLEHIKVNGKTLICCGEHIMTEADNLQLHHDFFGADEALSDYKPGKDIWVATIIVTGKNRTDAMAMRNEVIARIREQLGLVHYCNKSPKLPEFISETKEYTYVG
jgi:3-methylornithine--L-lysine ligase